MADTAKIFDISAPRAPRNTKKTVIIMSNRELSRVSKILTKKCKVFYRVLDQLKSKKTLYLRKPKKPRSFTTSSSGDIQILKFQNGEQNGGQHEKLV